MGTSEELAEVRSGGSSREAGVTLVILGLSLVNNLRIGERRGKDKGRRRRRVKGMRKGKGSGQV